MPDGQTPAPAAAPAPAPAPAKKSNATTVIIIVVVALVVLGVGGYFVSRYIARKAAEKLTEGIISAGTGGKVNVDSSNNSVSISGDGESISVGENATWPSDMPSDVPKYSKGKITSSSKIDNENLKSWSVVVAETSQSDFTAYKASVVAAGWKSDYESTSVIEIAQYTKGDYSLSAAYDASSSGATVTVTKN
ncbi:MAG: hypothetical protein WC451_02025 [Patescibacteria group bacterium]